MKTLRFLLLVLLCSIALGCGGGGGSDDSNDGGGNGLSSDACSTLGLQSRIINGTRCSTDNSPVVPIQLVLSGGEGALCSGTMISATHVLSAGHCFPSETRSAFITVNGARFNGVRFFRHPGYTETAQALFKDVAILELAASPGLPTVPLMLSQPTAPGDTIQIFGFGLTESGSIGNLLSGEMEVDSVTSDHIITTFNGDGSNTCQGDSGGPALLTVNGIVGIVGLTSSGFREDCLSGDTSLFANVQSADNLNFIRSIVPGVASR